MTFGDPDDAATGPGGTTAPGGPTASGGSGGEGGGGEAGATTIDDIERGETVRWDVSRPITAESVGLGESMAVVQVPDGAAEVELTLPDGTWTTTAEELTIQPRRGYVSAINVFRTLSGGQAVHDQLVADAQVLGFPRSQVDRWLDELPRVARRVARGRDAGPHGHQRVERRRRDVRADQPRARAGGRRVGAPLVRHQPGHAGLTRATTDACHGQADVPPPPCSATWK
nr:hypothetical protein [Cellulosimicrobium sp. MM]